jgi:energy-coupling factor transport system substrate-specific component
MMKKPFDSNYASKPFALIIVAVAINFAGKLAAESLQLPLWLDAIGTILASMVGGPVLGGLTGLANNVLYGSAVDPVAFAYALTSVAIGVTVGFLARFGFMRTRSTVLLLGVVVVLISTVVSTPINMVFYDGFTFNRWGDALYEIMLTNVGFKMLSAFCNEFVVDLPDKILSVLVAYFIYSKLPQGMLEYFNTSRREVYFGGNEALN